MRLPCEFIQLPLRFDVERLRKEAQQFTEYDWKYHPQRYDGNTALNLVSKDGTDSDAYVGNMRPTEALQQCQYVQQIIASLGIVVGRSRFMRLAPGKGVPAHSDTDYSWRHRVRIHIPVVTDPEIYFTSGAAGSESAVSVHKSAGEAWIFDNWREHSVTNDSDIERIHLVIDTVGTASFWKLVERGLNPKTPATDWELTVKQIEFDPDSYPLRNQQLRFERFNAAAIRSPAELDSMVKDFCGELVGMQQMDASAFQKVVTELEDLRFDWRALWAEFSDTSLGLEHYQRLVRRSQAALKIHLADTELKSNRAPAFEVINNWLDATINTALIRDQSSEITVQHSVRHSLGVYEGTTPAFDRPVFIVAAPRSGSTMLFEALKNNRELWTIGDEAHGEIEGIEALHPRANGFRSNRLLAEDCGDEIQDAVLNGFMLRLQNSQSAMYADLPVEYQQASVRFLEKTPKNALRIPFFKQMFPEAKFIFLHRAPEPNIGSIMDAWVAQKFVTYKDLPEWEGLSWSLLLVEGWERYKDACLAEIAAFQWAETNRQIMADLSKLETDQVAVVTYEGLLKSPSSTLESLCRFMEVPFGQKMQSFARTGFPRSKYALTEPKQDKWRRHEADILSVQESYVGIVEQLKQFGR